MCFPYRLVPSPFLHTRLCSVTLLQSWGGGAGCTRVRNGSKPDPVAIYLMAQKTLCPNFEITLNLIDLLMV